MARTTNSDTLPFVESRYELGMLASQRVRDLDGGAEPIVEKHGDKPTVVALREIATGKLDVTKLRHEFVQSYKEHSSDESIEVADAAVSEIDNELEQALMEDMSTTSAEDSAESDKDTDAE